MSIYVSRNVVIPIWFVIFAIGLFVVPSPNFVFSMFLVVMGLAVPTIAFMLWPTPVLQPVAVAPSTIDLKPHEGDSRT